MKDRTEILISGFGGQGVVRMGQIVGMAAVRQGYRATMLKSHGTEMRGGYVRSQVVISPESPDSPLVEEPDYFCALSSAAYKAYCSLVREGVILYDPAFVQPDESLSVRQLAISARDMATKELGQPVFANSIMLGALTKLIGFLDRENVLGVIEEIFYKQKEANRKAFEAGYTLFR